MTKPIEYKQASEDSYRNEGGIEKLVGHVNFDNQTFGNDSMDTKKQNMGVSFDASVDQDQQQNQKRKLKNIHTPIALTKYKTLTYREMKERERLRQSS